MADVHVFTKNNSGQTAGLTLDEDSEFLAHLKVMQRRGDLAEVKVVKPKATTK